MQRRYESENIPIEVLRSFVTILDTGSFTKAATVLGLTQSAISAQVKRLQRLLGDELFVRGVTNITLTDRGNFASERARRILALNDELISKSTGIRLGLPTLHGGSLLRAILQRCKRAGLDVHFYCDSIPTLRKRFEAGQLDIILDLSSDPWPDAEASWTDPVAWVSAQDLALSPVLPFVSWPGSPLQDIALRALNQSSLRYEVAVVASDLPSQLEAVTAGLGCAVVPVRGVPKDLKIRRDHFLPKLSPMHVGIRFNRDLDGPEMNAVIACLKAGAEPAGE